MSETAAVRLKRKVVACEDLAGTYITLNDCSVTEILGYIGFDFIWIDTEHTALDYLDLLRHIGAARMTGTAALVRVHKNDANHVKRVLEMGPDGIIFPMIDTAAEAEAAMRSSLYPPFGDRGFGPLRAVKYGRADLEEYLTFSRESFCRLIQIETETAVRNLPEIIKNPWIDGYIFGPCDLSGSIGRLGQVFCEENIALIKEAIALLRENGKCIGVLTGSSEPEVLEFWRGLGINLISAGVDYDYIAKGAAAVLAALRRQNA